MCRRQAQGTFCRMHILDNNISSADTVIQYDVMMSDAYFHQKPEVDKLEDDGSGHTRQMLEVDIRQNINNK